MDVVNWVCRVAVAAVAAVGGLSGRGQAAPRAGQALWPTTSRDGPTTLGGATVFARLSTIR